MNTAFLLMIIATSGLLLIGILGYFLYQKRKQLYHSEAHSPHLKEPFFADQNYPFSTISTMNPSPQASPSSSHNPKTNSNFDHFAKNKENDDEDYEDFNSKEWSAHAENNQDIASQVSNNLNDDDENDPSKEESDAEPFIVIFLISEPQKPYVGYDLLQAILSAGLRYDGKTNIFHRYERLQGRGTPLFSLASANEPGTFNLDRMGEVSCQGLCLFINLEEVKNPVLAFEKMLESVYQLMDDLGGELKNELGQTLNHDIISHYRARIGDYVAQHSYTNMT